MTRPSPTERIEAIRIAARYAGYEMSDTAIREIIDADPLTQWAEEADKEIKFLYQDCVS